MDTSALVLRGLTANGSGAMIAAPTTSLPEIVGGESNWDYRYGWLRDASFTVRALQAATCADEAGQYFRWMAGVAAGSGDRTSIVFRADGGADLDETTLDHLAGWRGSRPVRIGNDAHRQTQLDVPGEILGAAALVDPSYIDHGIAAFLGAQADIAAHRWRQPDAGIWEGREGERHYLSSKVMCWVALDRASRMADRLGLTAQRPRWEAERRAVAAAVLADGWHPGRQAFTGAFGSDHLDASALLLPLVGFLPATDERIAATIAAVESELTTEGLVHRWTGAEDAPFVMCSYWLAECHARAGRIDRAVEVFDAVTAHANDLGLLAEEVDPGSGELLGNFPQALSHAGLVNAADHIGAGLDG